jgi:hypothetical protein
MTVGELIEKLGYLPPHAHIHIKPFEACTCGCDPYFDEIVDIGYISGANSHAEIEVR